MTKKVSTYFKILFCLVFMALLMPQQATAQRKLPMNLPKYDYEPYHFGFILAYNEMLYSFEFIDNYQNIPHIPSEWPDNPSANADVYAYDIESSSTPGFTVGIVGNLRLGKYFDLRFIPSLSFGERQMEYTLKTIRVISPEMTEEKFFDVKKSIHSTFVEFPLQVKYRSKRLNNIAAYVIAGGNYKIDLASQKNKREVNVDGIPSTIIDNIKVRKTDFAAEIGAGFDFYTGYFKFGIEVKMSYGLLNILDPESIIYSSSIDRLHNKTFQLSFTFE